MKTFCEWFGGYRTGLAAKLPYMETMAAWDYVAAEKDKRIRELETELAKVTESRDYCKNWAEQIGGRLIEETRRANDLNKELANVRSELKLERECVDFYADEENWSEFECSTSTSQWIDDDDISSERFAKPSGGKRARQRIKERKG